MKSKNNLEALENYISGSQFTDSLKVDLSSPQLDIKRNDLLLQLCKDKRVIHLGFTDHLPLIEQRIKQGCWLHGLLDNICSECYGIDIDQEAVSYVQNKLGYKNTCCANILEEDILNNKSGEWDYIVLGEILEHVNDPSLFISTIRKKYAGRIKNIIITVPNAICTNVVRNIRNKEEVINSDHRYWFSPYTITKILHISGFKNSRILYANRCSLGFIRLVFRKIRLLIGKPSFYPATYFATLVAIAELSE
jgi:hypothetical protein